MSPLVIERADRTLFFWTVDHNVGVQSPNVPDDVQLVQLAYIATLQMIPHKMSRPLKEACAKVSLGAPCTGRADDPLVQAIVIHQRDRGGTQDGHVSKFNSKTETYGDGTGAHVHMIIPLVNHIIDLMKADFPRLDRYPGCPGALRASVIKACSRGQVLG